MQSLQKLILDVKLGDQKSSNQAKQAIVELAFRQGIFPASIAPLYQYISKNRSKAQITVPACNLRGLTFETSRTIFKTAKNLRVGPIIFEIARSETIYTHQSPQEYCALILAGALDAGWQGPVFLQADHMQPKAASPGQPKPGEIDELKKVITHYINAGFYNIDIDTSTLVDLDSNDVFTQQKPNIAYTSNLIEHIYNHIPQKITPNIGGEIGHIGGANSNSVELITFLEGVRKNKSVMPLTKVAIQNGTSHGGIINPDGTIKPVSIDFDLHRQLSQIAREHGLAGTVQHGASTINDKYYGQFPSAGTVEIHLATGIQNIIIDHPSFPDSLRQDMYHWLDNNLAIERQPQWNDIQFHYKLRKKAWAHHKQSLSKIDQTALSEIMDTISQKFTMLFKAFNLHQSSQLLSHINSPSEPITFPQDTYFQDTTNTAQELSD